jgi:stress-induced-phosphoprotein 1
LRDLSHHPAPPYCYTIFTFTFFPSQVEELKQKGNEAMKAGEYDSAINLYGEAIELSPDSHVLYSNRCAAYMKVEKYQEALDDAEKTIGIKADWGKVSV